MSENASAAEWLRGIIDECEVDRMRSCTAIAEARAIERELLGAKEVRE